MKIKSILFTVLLLYIYLSNNLIHAQTPYYDQFNCFSILVGKNASLDGSVIIAHNEDDGGTQLVNFYKVPYLTHDQIEEVVLNGGAHIPQVNETYSYLWIEMPRQKFSDSYMNQWGVVITSNQCSSKENGGVITNGGIDYWLRRLMAERAQTAKEAVKIGGQLIAQLGYTSSGRTYLIADPEEAWMMSVVKGKHWVAQRIPDDQVVMIPNYYTIGEIDLTDTVNFLADTSLIQYAILMNWYDTSSGNPFNFRIAYGSSSSFTSANNIIRHWRGINMLSAQQYNTNDTLPFSFVPANKVSVQDIIAVLRDHYEGTAYETTPNPHNGTTMTICSGTNQYGFVGQLRDSLPAAIGSVLWVASKRPCIQPFIPWYCGIDSIADCSTCKYYRNDYQTAIINHFNTLEDIYQFDSTLAYWVFDKLLKTTDTDYVNTIGSIKTIINNNFEQILFHDQDSIENQFLIHYQTDSANAIGQITDYTAYWAEKACLSSELFLDIEEIPGSSAGSMIAIHPNPANDKITIEKLQPADETALSVYDIKGQELLKRQIPDRTTQLDISKLPGGIYIIKFIYENGVEVKKFIKE